MCNFVAHWKPSSESIFVLLVMDNDTLASIAPTTPCWPGVLGPTQEIGAPFQAELEAADAIDKESLARHLQTVDKVCKNRVRYYCIHVNSCPNNLSPYPACAMSQGCLAAVLEGRGQPWRCECKSP